ncbi:hypothetical protein BDW59DRAFT_7002 [Aspergillus cavernicola]|uniref:EGF domain-specific O-linked N-acetylglucosamine transferase n=1 Tax=Aspergillus cavernicola TaxID=176166 RepID=A0ABR4ITM3_9EURO
MGAYKLASPRRAILAGVVFIIIILIFLTHNSFHSFPRAEKAPSLGPGREQPAREEEVQGQDSLNLPSEYTPVSKEPSFCAEHFGLLYLESLRDSATQYCTTPSSSDLTCFHSKTASDRVDTFCLGRNVRFGGNSRKFSLQCELGKPSAPELPFSVPKFNQFQTYWYETGPKVIFKQWVGLSDDSMGSVPSEPLTYLILVKREMAHNLWHSLMEIFSMTMSVDVLRITPRPNNNSENRPFVADSDLAHTQVVLLDDIEDGPFLELWSLLGNKPPIRIKDLPEDTVLQNIVVPLAGGSNPLWQGDWTIHSCEESALLRTFSRRVLDFHGLPSSQPRQFHSIVLTFIDRTSTRRLVNSESFLAELQSKYTHVAVQSFDFATITLKEQLEIIQATDILVGVHGAGLTHGFFLSPRSAVVEILPPKLSHKGFRNIASLMDLSYFSAHSDSPPMTKRGWQEEDVYLERERFLDLIDAAVKSMYNRGERNYDAV